MFTFGTNVIPDLAVWPFFNSTCYRVKTWGQRWLRGSNFICWWHNMGLQLVSWLLSLHHHPKLWPVRYHNFVLWLDLHYFRTVKLCISFKRRHFYILTRSRIWLLKGPSLKLFIYKKKSPPPSRITIFCARFSTRINWQNLFCHREGSGDVRR